MTFRKSVLLLIGLGLSAALVACGSSSSSSTPPPPPAITVTLSTTPTALYVKDTTPITAIVANDSKNGGVSWSCAPASTCGTFSSSQSASGVAVTYAAPAILPSSAVVITATSVTNTSISASAPAITINPASGIVVTLSKAAQFSLAVGATTTISATVANDPAKLGVNWSCTPATTCGSFSASETASAATTTYTAPTTTGPVVITATSISDDEQSASATVTVGASGILADGNYVFSLSGSDVVDGFGDAYFAAGVFVVKGGAINGGEQDFGDFWTAASDQINGAGSSISTTADGNLQITLQLCNAQCTQTDLSVGSDGVETLDASLVSPSSALITEFDNFASSSGTLELQTSTAAPSGGYAFYITGQIQNSSLSLGGIINVDGAGTISGTGSIFDANVNGSGLDFQAEIFGPSTVSSPDSNGRVTFTLNPTDSADFPQIVLAGYIADATHIRLVEVLDTLNGFNGGTAFSQGTNIGSFSSASVSGNSYVVPFAGFDDFDNFQALGLFTANADGTVSGAINYNDFTGTGVQSPSPITGGTYTVDATGRVTLTGVTAGILTNPLNLQFYLDGSGHAPALTMDSNDVGAGLGYQQTGGGSFTAASFSGAYIMSAKGVDNPPGTFFYNQNEFDAVGPVTADGVGTLAGFFDLNWLSGDPDQGVLITAAVPTPDLTVSGAFIATANGTFTGTITGLQVPMSTNQDAFTYFLIDTTRVLSIETDPNQLTLGYFELQPPQ
jgi:hypothetical protein